MVLDYLKTEIVQRVVMCRSTSYILSNNLLQTSTD